MDKTQVLYAYTLPSPPTFQSHNFLLLYLKIYPSFIYWEVWSAEEPQLFLRGLLRNFIAPIYLSVRFPALSDYPLIMICLPRILVHLLHSLAKARHLPSFKLPQENWDFYWNYWVNRGKLNGGKRNNAQFNFSHFCFCSSSLSLSTGNFLFGEGSLPLMGQAATMLP